MTDTSKPDHFAIITIDLSLPRVAFPGLAAANSVDLAVQASRRAATVVGTDDVPGPMRRLPAAPGFYCRRPTCLNELVT
jgi:hypothetical protein